MAIAKGTNVKQVVPAPVVGVVAGYNIDENTGEVQYLVEWTNPDGTTQSRYFSASQIEVVV